MAGRTARVIGTSLEAIHKAEQEVGFSFPPSFRDWLEANNGRSVGSVARIYPVFDDRDPRTTWDSISRNFTQNWADWIENFTPSERERLGFGDLLPIAEVGDGDLYCFDYNKQTSEGEVPVVRWSHETGEKDIVATSFADLVEKLEDDELDDD